MRQQTERLAEVRLMQPHYAAIRAEVPVVALDQQIGQSCNRARLHRRYRESKPGGKAHCERFVLYGRGKPLDRRLEDVGSRLTRLRQCDPTSDEDNRHLRLRPGKGQSQPAFRTSQKGLAGSASRSANQALVGQSLRLMLWLA